MERRYFFPSLFGLITGAASAAWPKPSPAPVPSEPVIKADSAEEDEGPELYFDTAKARPTHTDLAVLVSDVRRWVDAHPGAIVLSEDSPHYLQLGFVAFVRDGDMETSICHTISLSSMARTYRGVVDVEMIRSQSGRREFCADLMKGTA
jgi:hypothetical protein